MNDGLAAFAVLAYLAYLASRILARRHMPELVAFLVVGAVLGPSGVELISEADLARFRPLTEIVLAILMFVIGERVSTRAVREAPWAVTAGIVQFVITAGAVFAVARWLDTSRATSLLVATLAGAGAPMTVAHVVTTRRAAGVYPAGLIGTHAVSDALTVVAFAAVLPVAELLVTEDPDITVAALDFLQLAIGGFALGVALGLVISRVGRQIETSGELLLFVLLHLLIGWAIAAYADVSLPLAAVVAGSLASSVSPVDYSQRLFRTVRSIELPAYLFFFALAGAAIHIEDIPEVGVLGIAYIVVRTITKVVGGSVGGVLGGLRPGRAVRLGVDLIPQAGVAVGLAAIAAETLPDEGSEAATVVLASVVLFELVGPIMVAKGLDKDNQAAQTERGGSSPPAVDHHELPHRVMVASPVPVEVPDWVIDSCGRWHAALWVLQPGEDDDRHIEAVRKQASASMVELTVMALRQESFTGSVVRLATEIGADMVVLFTPRPPEPYGQSRLVLFPSERIARELSAPVLTVPLPIAGDGRIQHPRMPWWEDS